MGEDSEGGQQPEGSGRAWTEIQGGGSEVCSTCGRKSQT